MVVLDDYFQGASICFKAPYVASNDIPGRPHHVPERNVSSLLASLIYRQHFEPRLYRPT